MTSCCRTTRPSTAPSDHRGRPAENAQALTGCGSTARSSPDPRPGQPDQDRHARHRHPAAARRRPAGRGHDRRCSDLPPTDRAQVMRPLPLADRGLARHAGDPPRPSSAQTALRAVRSVVVATLAHRDRLRLGHLGHAAATTTGVGRATAPVTPAPPSSRPRELGSAAQPIVKKTPKALPTTRLADGLLPPTNRWFSGLAFGDRAQPVFPLPLSFGLTDDRLRLRAADRVTSGEGHPGRLQARRHRDGARGRRRPVSAYDT